MHTLTEFVTSSAVIMLPPLATALASLLVAYVSQKLRQAGIDIDRQKEQQLEDVASAAVAAVEEQARRAATTTPGVEKHEAAIGMVVNRLPDVPESKASAAIDAALSRLRGSVSVDIGKLLIK